MDKNEIKSTIENLIKALGVAFNSVEEVSDLITGKPVFVIKSSDSGLLIGEGGENYYALSHIIRKIASKGVEEAADFSIDVNDYRSSMVDRIKNKATILANRARDLKADIEMEPMNSYERLIVHGILTDQPNIKTESVGEGKERRIIIKYIK